MYKVKLVAELVAIALMGGAAILEGLSAMVDIAIKEPQLELEQAKQKRMKKTDTEAEETNTEGVEG